MRATRCDQRPWHDAFGRGLNGAVGGLAVADAVKHLVAIGGAVDEGVETVPVDGAQW